MVFLLLSLFFVSYKHRSKVFGVRLKGAGGEVLILLSFLSLSFASRKIGPDSVLIFFLCSLLYFVALSESSPPSESFCGVGRVLVEFS